MSDLSLCSTHSLINAEADPHFAQMEVQWLQWSELLACPPA